MAGKKQPEAGQPRNDLGKYVKQVPTHPVKDDRLPKKAGARKPVRPPWEKPK